jgi:aldoxime dehydratase
MESAISKHLQCPRQLSRRVEESYLPPYPAYTARATPLMEQVVMGYFGVQSKGADAHGKATAARLHIARGFGAADGPGHHDLAHFVDTAGYDNSVAIAYWSDRAAFARWWSNSGLGAWWQADDRLHDGLGYFREIASPRVQHYETLFNTPDRLEGIGTIMGGISDEIREHAYWGAARDRIPLSQTDALEPSRSRAIIQDSSGLGGRVRIAGHENVTIIRSGQEWTETAGRERELYLQRMEPVLREGMKFLCEQGETIGCYSNRYMRHIDAAGRPLEKTFGLSHWHSLADMESWAESHPTHLAIFGKFMQMVQELEFRLNLRLYHEVSSLKADEQEYEYINCHRQTGMLSGLST